VRRGRRRRDFSRSHHRPRDVCEIQGGGEGADPRQHHRVREDPALHPGGARGRERRHRALPALGVPRHDKAALNVYATLRKEGTQKNTVGTMQTREELYQHLGYHEFEQKLDALFAKSK
jgi:hypothetical protein